MTKIKKETLLKEIQNLVEIGVLTPVQKSQYVKPVFILINMEDTVRFITDYWTINQKIVRNTYNFHIIGDIMYQLEVLQYAIALNLNMGYYSIII